jgi:UDPglucose 6-dehydrogenase/GDP-mannose 6-dehydrogenase
MKISIVGAGYVGLVSGACLAEKGHEVTCVDNDERKVSSILARKAPIHEAGLDDLLARHAGARLRATADLAAAVAATDVTLIAVGTPAREGRIDTTYVEQAAREIGSAIRGKKSFHCVVVKSTVVPGTTDGIVRRAIEEASGKRVGEGFGLGMNPEFLTEGQAVADFMRPDRIVLGAADDETRRLLRELYAGFANVPIVETNNSTAEMIKYASNALLATMISFTNELARLSSRLGDVDAIDVMRGVHLSAYLTTRRDGQPPVLAPIASFLEPGCGFGGSCLPKDVTALIAHGDDHGIDMPLQRAVLAINRGQPDEVMRLLRKRLPDLDGVRVLVLGLTFKPDTDDLRESPAFPVIRLLKSAGAQVEAYDPLIKTSDHPDLRAIRLHQHLEQALEGAQAVVLITRWAEFADLARRLKAGGASPVVIDGRRLLSPEQFDMYEGIGR